MATTSNGGVLDDEATAALVVKYLVDGQEFQLTREEVFRFPRSFFARQQEFAAGQKQQKQISSCFTGSSSGPVDGVDSTPSPAPTPPTPKTDEAEEPEEPEESEEKETGVVALAGGVKKRKAPPPRAPPAQEEEEEEEEKGEQYLLPLVSPSREPCAVVGLPGRSPEFFGLIKEFYAATSPASHADQTTSSPGAAGGGSTRYRLVLGGSPGAYASPGGVMPTRGEEVRVSFVPPEGVPVQAKRCLRTPIIPVSERVRRGPWGCPACTYRNPTTAPSCEMCGTTSDQQQLVQTRDTFLADFPTPTVCSEVHISVSCRTSWYTSTMVPPFRVEVQQLSERGAAETACILKRSEVMPAPAQAALRGFLPNNSWRCIHEGAAATGKTALRCFLPDAVPTLRRFAVPSAWVETPEMQGLFWEEVQFYQLEELEASMAIELLQKKLRPFMVGPPERLRLRNWPGKDQKQLWATLWLALHFLPDRLYREHEVDWVISSLHATNFFPDCASIKKEFARRGLMNREPGGLGHTLWRAGVQAALDGEYRAKGVM